MGMDTGNKYIEFKGKQQTYTIKLKPWVDSSLTVHSEFLNLALNTRNNVVLFLNSIRNLHKYNGTSSHQTWWYNGSETPILLPYNLTKGIIFRQPQKSINITHICVYQSAGLDEFPIPLDMKYTIGDYTKEPKNITMRGDTIQTRKMNITNMITKIEYKLPKVLEMDIPSLAEHKKWANTQGFKHDEDVISEKTEVFYSTGLKTTIRWLNDLDMTGGNGVKTLEHTGFPYYFTMWNINELYGEWQETDWVAQDPKGMNKTFMTDWDRIYYLDWNFDMWDEPNDKPWIPKMVERGAIRNGSDIYRLFTAHYPQGYLYPPPDKKTNISQSTRDSARPKITSKSNIIPTNKESKPKNRPSNPKTTQKLLLDNGQYTTI